MSHEQLDQKHTASPSRYTVAMRTAVILIAAMLVLAGCRSATNHHDWVKDAEHVTRIPKMYLFSADHYPAVHAAAVEVLRDHGFRVARNDYRFGRVTTFAKESPTFIEFWIDDATTRTQRRSDTLNAQQRNVTVRIRPVEPEPPYSSFRLTVEVIVERLQRPERYLTHSAAGLITAAYTATPASLTERGIDGPYAQTLTRDPLLEQRLIEAIREAAESIPSE